jgi:hypothetical protein
MLTLERNIQRDHEQKYTDQGLGLGVAGETLCDSRAQIARFELGEAKSCKGSGLTGATARRITWSKRKRVLDTDATQIRRMDRSRVVTAGSGSCKSEDGVSRFAVPGKFEFRANADRHGVSNVDCDHVIPRDLNLIEGIDDRDALVVNDHFGSQEDHLGEQRDQASPEQSRHTALDRKVSKALVGVDSCGEKSDSSEDRTTSRSKGHRVPHAVIISWRGN